MIDLYLLFGAIEIAKIGGYVVVGAFAIFWLIVSVTDLLQRYGMMESKAQKERDQRQKRIENKLGGIREVLYDYVKDTKSALAAIQTSISEQTKGLSILAANVQELQNSVDSSVKIMTGDDYGLKQLHRQLKKSQNEMLEHLGTFRESALLTKALHSKIMDQTNQGNVEEILRLVRGHDRDVHKLMQRHPDGVEGRETPRHFCSVHDVLDQFGDHCNSIGDKIEDVNKHITTLENAMRGVESTLTSFPGLLDNVKSGQKEWIEHFLDQNKHIVGLLKALTRAWGEEEE